MYMTAEIRSPKTIPRASQPYSRAGSRVVDGSFKVKPIIFDPDHTGIVAAAWMPHEGLPKGGHLNQALYLAKQGDSTAFAWAGAVIDDAFGMSMADLTELGFDYRDDGHWGIRSPRFDVEVDGEGYFFIYSSGILHPAPDNPAYWTRVRFRQDHIVAAGIPLDGNISRIAIVFDEGTDHGPGFVYLDNIDINGTLISHRGFKKNLHIAPSSGSS